MTSTVVVELIQWDNGDILVLPSELWIELASTKAEFIDAKEALEEHLSAMRSHPGYQKREFTFRHYTYGEEMAAKRKGTTLTVNGPIVDAAVVNRELMKVAYGLSDQQCDDLHPAITQMLLAVLSERMHPTREMVDFFVFKRTTLPATASSTVQEPDAAK